MVQKIEARKEGDDMEDRFQGVDTEKVRELVGSILTHPSFRETLNNVFSLTMRASNAEQRRNQCSNNRLAAPDEAAQSSTTCMPLRATAAQEFAAIFRRGGSTQR